MEDFKLNKEELLNGRTDISAYQMAIIRMVLSIRNGLSIYRIFHYVFVKYRNGTKGGDVNE